MASFRKKLHDLDKKDEPAIAALPNETAAQLPPVAENTKPPEPIDTPSSIEDAQRNALRDRLREMNQAEAVVKSSLAQQQRLATEPRQNPAEAALAQMPPRVQRWFREYPEL